MLSNLDSTYKYKLEMIEEHFGVINQKAKLWEEIEEFQIAIRRAKRNLRNFNNLLLIPQNAVDVIEELTDCYIVAYQIDKIRLVELLLSSIILENFRNAKDPLNSLIAHYDSKILEIAKHKIDRTLERIESGYYEPDICPNCGGDGGFENPFGGNFIDCELCNGTGKVERKEK